MVICTEGSLRILADHWGIAASMVFGSYFAGSTPMGGGTIGFPILVLAFDGPASLGRDFSFAIQSIGMTSATIFILCRRQPLEWVMLRWAMLGVVIGAPLGILFIAPLIPGVVVKCIFAVIWASFGVLHLRRTNDICANEGITPAAHKFDRNLGFLVGLIAGGTITSVTGVGVDMVLYLFLVLFCRADLKVAIPTSVVLMTFASLVGLATKVISGDIDPGVFPNWLAAAPIVAVGAPFGALIVSRIGRRPTLLIVAVLCVGQFFWTMHHEFSLLGWLGISLSVVGVLLFNVGFEFLWRIGDRLGRRQNGGKPSRAD